MRLSALLAMLALTAPLSAFAQLNVHYELNEEGPRTAQPLLLKRNQPAVMRARPGEHLTAVDLPADAVTNLVVEKRYWYSAQANWREEGASVGYRRAGKWIAVTPDKKNRVQLGYETGTPPEFYASYWKKARDNFISHTHKKNWAEVAAKCSGPHDAGSWGNADGAYCNVSADAVELRFTETEKGRHKTYSMTYMLSRGL